MSEMTATRIFRGASLLVVVGLWLAAAMLLWRTRVPPDLTLPHVDAGRLFPADELRRTARYARFLRWDWIAQTLAQVGALGALAWAASRRRVPRLERLRGAPYGVAAVAVAWLAALPFGLAARWWELRYGIARNGYGTWLAAQLPDLGVQLVVGAAAAALLVSLARRLGRRWWLAAAPLLALVGVVVVAGLPLLAGGTRLDDPALRAAAQRLERAEGLGNVRLEVDRASRRTRAANADALGLGPTTKVVLWDTLLQRPFSDAEVRFTLAHELAHVARRHIWKGVAWFALLALPGAWLLAAATERRGGVGDPRVVPHAALVLAVLQLAALPLASAISRRYEAEADWLALETTRDPAAARALYRHFARVNLTQPDPPAWAHDLFGDHPTLLERIAQADAWAARNR